MLANVAALAQVEQPAYEKRQVIMPTEHKSTPAESLTSGEHRDYSKLNQGFWFSVEGMGGYSMNVSDRVDNTAIAEVDLYGGYRVNEYLRVGLGLGARYYFEPGNLREKSHKWGMPIMLNVRGNFIPQDYRTVVPYYSLDIGGTVPDGFMLRPTIGARFGQPRSAFVLGLSYMLQNMKGWELKDGVNVSKNRPISFLMLRLGYEF